MYEEGFLFVKINNIVIRVLLLFIPFFCNPALAFDVDTHAQPNKALEYEATWVEQTTAPQRVFAGQTITIAVTYKNTGATSWDSGVCLNVYKDPNRHTAPDTAYDKPGTALFGTSYWKTAMWVRVYRPICVDKKVVPSDTAVFSLQLKIPPQTPVGLYFEDFSLAVDKDGKQGWMYANAPYGKLDVRGAGGTGDPLGVAHLWFPINVADQEDGFYFSGQGRDLYQGHGLGMSQYGAYGAAEKGYTAEQIIKFYYTDVGISKSGKGLVTIEGIGEMDIEEYLAGLGEIPDKACGSATQMQQNPEKYKYEADPTFWDCWPEEAIKAQVIAARAYALSYSGTLTTDAKTQVYKGGDAKKWAAQETKGIVPIYDGKIIRAYYSSDNNQGHGTANHETIWSNFEGEVSPLPYIRSVDDSSFAHHSAWTDWEWSTDIVTYEQINDILQFESVVGERGRDFLVGVLSDVGSVTGIDFTCDPSGRIWKITLSGEKGKRVIAGWFFKELWNDAYAAGVAPGMLYSQTFSLQNI
jgi:hypothetical protein